MRRRQSIIPTVSGPNKLEQAVVELLALNQPSDDQRFLGQRGATAKYVQETLQQINAAIPDAVKAGIVAMVRAAGR